MHKNADHLNVITGNYIRAINYIEKGKMNRIFHMNVFNKAKIVFVADN
jgi:hypothetical protein